jgi:hypothetical protein
VGDALAARAGVALDDQPGRLRLDDFDCNRLRPGAHDGGDLDTGASRAETARAWWQRFADPALWPYERLFFELYAQALQGRTHALALTEDLLEPWIGPVAELYERRGMTPRRARAAARLGVAVTRGLLLDLLASGERAGVDDAMELFIELSEPLFGD